MASYYMATAHMHPLQCIRGQCVKLFGVVWDGRGRRKNIPIDPANGNKQKLLLLHSTQ